MLLILFLILAMLLLWVFCKSVSRFKTEYVWYKHSRRPTNRACRTIVNRQQRNCSRQCPPPATQLQTCQTAEQQFYYVRPQNPSSHQQVPVMEMAIPYNYAQPFYNHPGMNNYQYLEPPPAYPGYMPSNNEPIRFVQDPQPFPTAPPMPETKG